MQTHKHTSATTPRQVPLTTRKQRAKLNTVETLVPDDRKSQRCGQKANDIKASKKDSNYDFAGIAG